MVNKEDGVFDPSESDFVIDSRKKLEAVVGMNKRIMKKAEQLSRGESIPKTGKTYPYPQTLSKRAGDMPNSETVEKSTQDDVDGFTNPTEKINPDILLTLQNENKYLKEEYVKISQLLQISIDKLSEQTTQEQSVLDLKNKVRLLTERHQELLIERNDAVEKMVALQDDLKTLRQQTYEKARHDIDKQTDDLQQEKVNTDLGII